MFQTKQILTEIDRSKQLIKYTTQKKKIQDQPVKIEEKIEEGKIITLSEFLRG